eukprot:Lithocolla_globosa_v1_NODE_6002_length_1151_cov_13.635949.p1 type:complete len:303 gc:universal NODE_6002_length_1151_cov_13.635949:937-29(-)
MAMSFRRKFHLVSSKLKNRDAETFRNLLRSEYDRYCESSSASPLQLKQSKKALLAIQKNLADIVANEVRFQVRLSNMPLNVHGLTVLVRALSQVKFVRSLSLVKCSLDSDCVNSIVQLLQNPSVTIEDLNLSQNDFEESAFQKLAVSFANNPSVRQINLSSTSLTDSSARHFLTSLPSRQSPTQLDFSKNSISSELGQELLEILTKNLFVTWVNLGETLVDAALQQQLQRLCERNMSVASVFEDMMNQSCRRTFRTKLVNFRSSVHQNRSTGNGVVEDEPVYKWLAKGAAAQPRNLHIPSGR